MTTMLENVARALAKNRYGNEACWASLTNQAMVAIEAMREPTPAVLMEVMSQVNRWQDEIGSDQDIWEAGITAAQKESKL